MRISKNLKLVIPVYNEDELVLSVHVEPLSREAFEANHKILARAWSDVNAAGIGAVGMMTTAALMLKDAAIDLYGSETVLPDGTPRQNGVARYNMLMVEILRGATAIIPSTGQWAPVPYDNAKNSGCIDAEDAATVESLVAFFILASRMVDPHWGTVLRTALQLNYSAQFTSLSAMDYGSSLRTSMLKEASGAKAT